MTSLSIKSTVFLSGSPLSNEISKRRGDARENAVHKNTMYSSFFLRLYIVFLSSIKWLCIVFFIPVHCICEQICETERTLL